MNPQHTNGNQPTPGPDQTADTAADDGWWPRLVDRINQWWMHREPTGPAVLDMLRIPPTTATAAILGTLAVVATLAAALLWWLVTTLIGVIAEIAAAIGHAAYNGAEHVTGWAITRTITEPVHHYLTNHAAGLPIPAHLAWSTWLATTGVLFLAAVLGSRGARIGWTLTGALTTAMVYTATTPIDARALAAGLTITAWSVLSVAAFNQFSTEKQHHFALTIRSRRVGIPAPDDDTNDNSGAGSN